MDIQQICSTWVQDVQKLCSKPEEPKEIRDSRILAVALRAIGAVIGTYSALSILSAVVTAATAPFSSTVALIVFTAFVVLSHDAIVVGQNISNQVKSLIDPTAKTVLQTTGTIWRGLFDAVAHGIPIAFTDTWVAGSIYKTLKDRKV